MKRENLIKKLFSLLTIFILLSTIFLFIYPSKNGSIYRAKISLLITTLIILSIYIRTRMKGFSYKKWNRTDIPINFYLFISIFSFNGYIIIIIINNFDEPVVFWLLILVPIIWFILFILNIFIYNMSLKYTSGFFRFFNIENIDKIMTEINKFMAHKFEGVTFEKRNKLHYLTSSLSNNIIKIKTKSVIIHSFDDKVIVCGKKEKNVKEILKMINNNVMSNIEI